MPIDPEEYLSSLSEQLLPFLKARPDSLLASSTKLQAVANAFVVLGLLEEPRAEELLFEHRLGIERLGIALHGVSTGELTLRSGSAHGFAEARAKRRADLREMPLAVATPWSLLGDIQLEWLVRTPAGVRGNLTVYSPGSHSVPAQDLIDALSIADDAGRHYELESAGGMRSSLRKPRSGTSDEIGFSYSMTVFHLNQVPADVAWLEFSSPRAETAVRCHLSEPPSLPTGRLESVNSSPAERYVSWLTPDLSPLDPEAQVGVGLSTNEAADVAVTVGGALFAVGALPTDSPLLRDPPPSRHPLWQAGMYGPWATRTSTDLRERRVKTSVVALGNLLPFEQATVAVEWLAAFDDAVMLQLYVSPDVSGEYWPVSVRTFQARAIDDTGQEHVPIGARRWGAPHGEGWGDTLLWPPIGDQVRHLRLEVTTLWEAAWVEIDIPGR